MPDYAPASEIDFRSLRLLMERAPGSEFKRRREIAKITKAYHGKNGKGLVIPPHGESEQQKWMRCEARFCLGEYSDWSGWELRDPWAKRLWCWPYTKPYPIDAWDGTRVKKLYVIGEQGVGDEVFFASVLPDIIKLVDEVVFECQPRLRCVFERSFGVKTTPAHIEGTKRFRKDLPEGTSAWFPLGDFGRRLRTRLSDFPGTPYLKADPAQVERFTAYRGRVGVSWRGAQGAIPELMKIPGALSLQYDRGWDEDVEEPEGLDLRNDVEGILGLLSNLSSVVSVSTSVAHFSAALGIPTDVIIADPASGVRGNYFPFKWLCQATPGRTPWYSSAKVYGSFREYNAS